MSTVWGVAFWRDYVITMRPYLLFLSGITGVAGLALASPASTVLVLPAVLAFFLSYGFGQALTDCFQLDTDRLSAPERPLVRGRIRRLDTLLVSLLGLAVCGAIVSRYHPVNIPLAAAAVVGLASYTWFKRRWWAGPFYNACIVVVLAVIGYLSGNGAAGAPVVWNPAIVATLAAVFFGYANFVLVGYSKDMGADRATGYATLPVTFGLRRAATISDVFALLAWLSGALAAMMLVPRPVTAWAWMPFLAGAALATGLAQHRVHRLADEAEAYRAIVPATHAYVLLLAAVAAASRPRWAVPLAVLYSAFAFAMTRRPSRRQV